MNPPSHENTWSDQWKDYLSDQKLLEESDDSLILPDSSRDSTPPVENRHLASGALSPAELLRKKMRESINYDRLADSTGFSLHNTGPASKSETAQRSICLNRGEIIQLDPAISSDWNRPVFVMILDSGPKTAQIVPFGPLDLPASDGELITGLEETGLNVLCVWNTTEIPLSMLDRHFKIAHTEDKLVSEVNSLLLALRNQEKVPAELASRIGPSRFRFSLDKQDYFDCEEALLSFLVSS